MNTALLIGKFLLVAVLIAAIVAVIAKKKERENKDNAKKLVSEIRDFYGDFVKDEYIIHSVELKAKEKYKTLYEKASGIRLMEKNDVFEMIREFRNDLQTC